MPFPSTFKIIYRKLDKKLPMYPLANCKHSNGTPSPRVIAFFLVLSIIAGLLLQNL